MPIIPRSSRNPFTTHFNGFEFAISRDGVTEWHQTKINAPNGNWTISALKRENVLAAFKARLEMSTNDHCLFVSQNPATILRELVGKAILTTTAPEFVEGLGQDQKCRFEQVMEAWGSDVETTHSWLNWCRFLTFPEEELEANITSLGDLYFVCGGASAFPVLRDYLEQRLIAASRGTL